MGKELSEMTREELGRLFPILLKEHDLKYKDWYALERDRLLQNLSDGTILRIQHIGSSAVEGLVAKPTIDILLEVSDETSPEKLKEELQRSGWILTSAKEGAPLRLDFVKGYTKEGFEEKVYHLHIRPSGDWDEPYFRDYLRDNRDTADEYARLKLSLLETYRYDRDGYTEAKIAFIARVTALARARYGKRHAPVERIPRPD